MVIRLASVGSPASQSDSGWVAPPRVHAALTRFAYTEDRRNHAGAILRLDGVVGGTARHPSDRQRQGVCVRRG